MIDLDLSIDEESFAQELEELEMELAQKTAMAFELTGAETVAFLRSLTSQLVPGVNPGEGPRQAHPGGWSDVTGNLANAYQFQVLANGGRIAWSAVIPLSGTEEAPAATAPVGVEHSGNQPGPGTRSLELLLANVMEYATFLEAKDGFYVLSGVTDRGGPVFKALERLGKRLGYTME